MRLHELFDINTSDFKDVVVCSISKMFRQERDWTCSIACIRTLVSSKYNISENTFIERYNLSPGPYYSKDIKRIGLLKDLNVQVVYGCDKLDVNFDYLLDLITKGYNVMVECLYNYAHWLVIMGYYPTTDDLEINELLLYDPYYNIVRLVKTDEFISMWVDGNYAETKVKEDFIAIKVKGVT